MEEAKSQKKWFVMRDIKPWNAKNPAYNSLYDIGVCHIEPENNCHITSEAFAKIGKYLKY